MKYGSVIGWAFILSLVSVVVAVAINERNLGAIKPISGKVSPYSTVVTNDDASYLNPAWSYADTGVYRDRFAGRGSYFHRPPGYPALFILFSPFGREGAVRAVKYFQIVLFGISVIALFYAGLFLFNSVSWAAGISALYGLSGMASGFVYYTLTEGITPALVILSYCFVFRSFRVMSDRAKWTNLLLASLFLSWLIITRPVLAVCVGILPLAALRLSGGRWQKWVWMSVVSVSVSLAPLGIWSVRNYRIAGEWVGLHPVAYEENSLNNYRPAFFAVWDFCKQFETSGTRFNSYMIPLWEEAIAGAAGTRSLDHVLSHLPHEVVHHFGEERLRSAFETYQAAVRVQKHYYERRIHMPADLPAEELRAVAVFGNLEREYRNCFPFKALVATPVQVWWKAVAHSNLSLYVYQHSWRGRWWMEIWRFLCAAIHLSVFLLLPFTLIGRKHRFCAVLIAGPVLVYFAYLVFVPRSVEERYILPVLGVSLLLGAHGLRRGLAGIRQKLSG